jgi:hypothetical protein
MNIQPLGFVDTSTVAALYVLKHKEAAVDGVLQLRDLGDDGSPRETALLRGWKGARALLSKIRAGAAPFFEGVTPELGKAWIETLPPQSATPWTICGDEYDLAHIRLRVCLVPSPGAMTCSGEQQTSLLVGMVNRVEHRVLHCEVNHAQFARTHLVVDVRRADDAD